MIKIFNALTRLKKKADISRDEVVVEKKRMTSELKDLNKTLKSIIDNGKIQSEIVIKNIDKIIKESTEK